MGRGVLHQDRVIMQLKVVGRADILQQIRRQEQSSIQELVLLAKHKDAFLMVGGWDRWGKEDGERGESNEYI